MLLHDSRLKIERANEHIENIKGRIVLLHATDTARVDIDPKTGGEFLEHSFRDITAFDDIALMLGDTVHNLNCALDYTWLQIVRRLMPSLIDDRAKFPVRKTVAELKGSMAKAGINSTSPGLFGLMVDTIKLYSGGNNAIWPIHCFDISDKHRLMIPVLSSGNIDGITILDENGESWPGRATSEFLQRPPYVVLFKRGLHIKEKGKLTADIVIEDVDSGESLQIPATLMAYSQVILGVVEVFERFL